MRREQLRAGRALPRRYRNRRIGELLKELPVAEGRSTGIPKILDAMTRNVSPPAEFEFDEDHSDFMTRLRVHPQARPGAPAEVTAQVTTEGQNLSSILRAGSEHLPSAGITQRPAGLLEAWRCIHELRQLHVVDGVQVSQKGLPKAEERGDDETVRELGG